jgi:hypothetical protein
MVAPMPLARPAAWLEPRLVRGDPLVPKRSGHLRFFAIALLPRPCRDLFPA